MGRREGDEEIKPKRKKKRKNSDTDNSVVIMGVGGMARGGGTW